jgi:hypothetical protein
LGYRKKLADGRASCLETPQVSFVTEPADAIDGMDFDDDAADFGFTGEKSIYQCTASDIGSVLVSDNFRAVPKKNRI